MKRPFKSGRAMHAHGLTLIELMVSIAIGLVMMIAISSAYIGTSGAGRMAEAQGRMNEDAQAALSILAQQIRMAGDNPRQPNYEDATRRNPVFGTSTYTIRGCDGAFSDVTTAASITALTCTAGTNSLPDSIAISYEADTSNTVPASGVPTDCLGQGLTAVVGSVNQWNGVTVTAAPVTYYVADNRFYLATPTAATAPSMYCKGSGGATQPLVENIEDLQLLYGTGPATGTMTMAGYLSANSVESAASLAALTDSQSRWARTMTARICILARSDQPVLPDSASAAYYPCFSDTLQTPSDLYLRRAYYSTVVMRNRVPPSP